MPDTGAREQCVLALSGRKGRPREALSGLAQAQARAGAGPRAQPPEAPPPSGRRRRRSIARVWRRQHGGGDGGGRGGGRGGRLSPAV